MAPAQVEVDLRDLTDGSHCWAMSPFLKGELICECLQCVPQMVRATQLLAKSENERLD